MRRALLLLLATLALAPPASALNAASPLHKLLVGYARIHAINPCKHSTKSLQMAVSEMTPSLIKTQPLFYAALQTALSTRQAGLAKCTGASARRGAGAAAPTTPGAAAPALPAAPATPPSAALPPAQPTTTLIPQPSPQVQTTTQHKISVPALILAGLLIAAALLGLGAAALTSGAREPQRLAGSRHAFAEAAFRMRQTMREFGDWVRLGR
ncbi:MAG: hypothetical protein ACR2ND_14705 [Solirubrobacteraceae bacterium]